MDHFVAYKLRDFLENDDFVRWVKYPDNEQDCYWELVIKTYPHQAVVMEQAKMLIRELADYYPEVPESEIEKAREVILSIRQERILTLKDRLGRYAAVAAVLVLVSGLGWWWSSRQNVMTGFREQVLTESASPTWEELYNDSREVRIVTLGDGSTVHLEPGSHLRFREYPEEPDRARFDRVPPARPDAARREVYLEGEAFFEVARKPEKPFYVYAYGLVTKVLGTSFRVTGHRNAGEVKVQVSTGVVTVYREKTTGSDPEASGLVLTPNQQAVFKKEEEKLTRSLVEQPKTLVSPERFEAYAYSYTPIAKIFEALEKLYGVKIIYDTERFSKCMLTMSFSDESLYENLDVISKVVDAGYQIIDAQIVFSGSGCSE